MTDIRLSNTQCVFLAARATLEALPGYRGVDPLAALRALPDENEKDTIMRLIRRYRGQQPNGSSHPARSHSARPWCPAALVVASFVESTMSREDRAAMEQP